LTPYGGG